MLRSTPCGRVGLAMRQLALGDAVGPVAEILERRAAEVPGELVHHLLAGLARLHAAHPRLLARLELAERRRDRARGQLAQLMAADAADVLHLLEPVGLRDLLGDVALAAELALRPGSSASSTSRSPDSIAPPPPRSAPRTAVRLSSLPGSPSHLRRIDQTVAAHPDLVFGLRQIGDEVAALIVGDDDPGELGRQVGGLRDHPDAGFRPARRR